MSNVQRIRHWRMVNPKCDNTLPSFLPRLSGYSGREGRKTVETKWQMNIRKQHSWTQQGSCLYELRWRWQHTQHSANPCQIKAKHGEVNWALIPLVAINLSATVTCLERSSLLSPRAWPLISKCLIVSPQI